MSATLDTAQIQSIDIALVETFENTKALSVSSPVKTSVGGFHAAKAYNPVFNFTAKGRGDVPAGVAVGTDGSLDIDEVTGGKTIVLGVKKSERHAAHNGWEFNGVNYPGA